MDFLHKIDYFITHNQLFNKSNNLLVAVSGGADSVVLLHALLVLGYRCNVAHCNFHLRGDDSNNDATFVENLATKYQLPLFRIDFDTEKYANAHKLSIEMAARELRYTWFNQLCAEHHFDYVVVAHHANDNAETFLLNLTRGTGIRGLRGMRPKNEQIVRPLLYVTRQEIETYARENALDFCTDKTNFDTKFTRNHIRHDIVPELEQINSNFVETMVDNLQHLRDVNAIFDDYIARKRAEICQQQGEIEEIDVQKLQASIAPQTVLFEILHEFGFNATQVQLIFDNMGTSGLQFTSSEFCVITNRNKLLVSHLQNTEHKQFTLSTKTTEIVVPIHLRFDYLEQVPEIDKQNCHVAYFDADKLEFPLTLRQWQQGDTFTPFGMNGSKKLSDFFIDQKLSLAQKSQQWLLCDATHILWVIGLRAANHYKITGATKRVIKITYFPDKQE